jgi:hypothetical protein
MMGQQHDAPAPNPTAASDCSQGGWWVLVACDDVGGHQTTGHGELSELLSNEFKGGILIVKGGASTLGNSVRELDVVNIPHIARVIMPTLNWAAN